MKDGKLWLQLKTSISIFFSWLDPFDWSLWIVVVAEIYIASLILVLTEGYGTNENLWMDNIFSTCYDSFYWYANSFEGIAMH